MISKSLDTIERFVFGTTLSPIYAEKAEEFLCSDITWHWYRFPWQRAPLVCQNSGWQDIFVQNIEYAEPLEDISRLWRILDSFDIENAEWKPYFDNEIIVSNEHIRISYYKKENELLCLAANMQKSASAQVMVTLPEKAESVLDMENMQTLATQTERFSLEFESFGYRIFKVKM